MIVAPNQTGSRSVLADWLEVEAVKRGFSGTALLRSAFAIEDDERGVDDDEVEVEIAEQPLEDNLDRVAEEIGFRYERLAEKYPFVLEQNNKDGTFVLRYRPVDGDAAHIAYVFQLFVSACRDSTITNSDQISALVKQAEKLFHICASIGVAGLLEQGHTFWFGFPRPEGNGFMAALACLCEKLGFGLAKKTVPQGLPRNAKDDDIDVVGWRQFSDQRVGGLIIVCQAASGANWGEKSILPSIQKFQDSWFEKKIYAYGVGALAFPFTVHHAVELADKGPDESFSEACHNYLIRHHSSFGVLLDRMRITEAAECVMKSPTAMDRVAGLDQFNELNDWSQELKGYLE